jgi:hypothetical protein
MYESPFDDTHVAVEILLDRLRVRILENWVLLAALEERDLFIDQLEAQIRFLEGELRRRKFDTERARSSARIVKRLIKSATVVAAVTTAFGTIAMAVENANPRPLTELHSEDTNEIIKACNRVLGASVDKSEASRSNDDGRTSNESVEQSHQRAAQLRQDADDYVDRKLAAFEVILDRTMQQVVKGRQRLSAPPMTPGFRKRTSGRPKGLDV